MPEFDAAAAKAAGYTDDEIAEFLGGAPAAPASAQNFDVEGAKAAGYTDDEIAAFIGTAPTAAQTGPDIDGFKSAWQKLGESATKSGDPNAITGEGIRALARQYGIDSAALGNADEAAAYWQKNQRFSPDVAVREAESPPVLLDPNTPPADPQNPVLETLGNVPGSAANFASDFVQPFLHPIQAAKSIGEIGAGVLAKAGIGDADEATANAVGEFLAERYGGTDKILNTIKTDPVGFLADASILLTGGGSLAARAPGMAGRAGRAVAATGRAIDPVVATARAAGLTGRAVGAVGAPLVTNALGLASGAGTRAVSEAARAGYAGGNVLDVFRAHMRGQAPVEDVVAAARQAIQNMAAERSAAYQAGIQDTAASGQVLPFGDIDRAVAGVRNRGFFGTQPINPAAAGAWTEIDNLINEWRGLDPTQYHTPMGMDALKRAVGSVRDGLPFGTPGRSAADAAYNAIRQEIVQAVPTYARTMRQYEQASSALQELEKTFSLGRQAPIDSAMRKLQSIFRNNANTNYGRRAELGERLVDAGATGLNEMLAGQALSSATPRGIQGALAGPAGVGLLLTNPGLVPGLAATSPRLVGEAASAAGSVARGASAAGRAGSRAYTPGVSAATTATAIGGRGIDDPDALQILGEKYENAPVADPVAEPEQPTPAPQPAPPAVPSAATIKPEADFGEMPFQSLRQRQIQQESGGRSDVTSKAGAFGVSQLMPATAKNPGHGIAPLRDNSPEENMRLGDEYLAVMLNKYRNQPLALMAYNWGPAKVDRWLKGGMRGNVPPETRNYVNTIMGQKIFPGARG